MTTKVGRPIKAKDDLQNTFVDELVNYLIPQFEALSPMKTKARELGNTQVKGWKQLAAQTSRDMMLAYPDDRPDGEKEYTTCWAQIAKLKRALDKAASSSLVEDKANTPGIKTINKHFEKALYQFFSVYRQNTAIRYKQQVHTRSLPENRIQLDLTEYLMQAQLVLESVHNQQTESGKVIKVAWEDVSCALALVTGRRMAEIHLAAEFETVEDEFSVMFKGQLKGKGRKASFVDGRLVDGVGKAVRDVGFVIPTLVRSDLVIAGLEYLKENGKRLNKSDDTNRVNARYSKALSARVKEYWPFMGEETTYHKFRSAYFLLCLVNKNIDAMDALDYITVLLGDTSKDAQDAYKRFKIVPNSLTIIK